MHIHWETKPGVVVVLGIGIWLPYNMILDRSVSGPPEPRTVRHQDIKMYQIVSIGVLL